jgi:NADH:ubiquinone oxidoreductase subunit F (NADH-binding)/NADH:ubiquinone oxidoreductase subunit E
MEDGPGGQHLLSARSTSSTSSIAFNEEIPMAAPDTKSGPIRSLARHYPHPKSALLPALDLLQRENDSLLTTAGIETAAQALGVTASQAYGTASFYTLLNRQPVGRYHLQVDTSVPAVLRGALDLLAQLEKMLQIRPGETTPDGLFTLSEVDDLGAGGTCPVIQVNDEYYENLDAAKVEELIRGLRSGQLPEPDSRANFDSRCGILLKNRAWPDSVQLTVYQSRGGYSGLAAARAMNPAEIVRRVKDSGLRGRGGAGFPTGRKWEFLARDPGRPAYLICNADEGEPGTFKDRVIMQYDPHLLLEGIAIAARAIEAKTAFIYIRGEFRSIAGILTAAIEEARADGQLDGLELKIHLGAGSYLAGEETALIESLEGKRACPRPRPPFPATKGLYDCPTIVNNVETLACLPFILTDGPEAFRRIGCEGNTGPKLFCLSGHIERPGVYEYPLGTPLQSLLDAAGGVAGRLKAIIPGGLSAPILTAAEAADLRMDFDSCTKKGTMIGSGGIIVMNDTVSIPEIALRTARFYAHESCGQCVPCREGTYAVVDLLTQLVEGRGGVKTLDTIRDICRAMRGTSLCPTGDCLAMTVGAMVSKFREEFARNCG